MTHKGIITKYIRKPALTSGNFLSNDSRLSRRNYHSIDSITSCTHPPWLRDFFFLFLLKPISEAFKISCGLAAAENLAKRRSDDK